MQACDAVDRLRAQALASHFGGLLYQRTQPPARREADGFWRHRTLELEQEARKLSPKLEQAEAELKRTLHRGSNAPDGVEGRLALERVRTHERELEQTRNEVRHLGDLVSRYRGERLNLTEMTSALRADLRKADGDAGSSEPSHLGQFRRVVPSEPTESSRRSSASSTEGYSEPSQDMGAIRRRLMQTRKSVGTLFGEVLDD